MSAERILVVDDNPTNLKLVSDLLEFEGYQILKAVDAEEAQLVIQRTPPDLILMDIALPGMDGLTLTRKLKSDEMTRHIIIVALTAFAMKGDDAKAHAAGCDGYITKPIDTRKLPELVADFLLRISSAIADSETKILVIEDHPVQRKLANLVLSATGNNVTSAESSEEAFMAIKKDRPEVILLDLALPGMDGLTLARQLKADAETRDIPVIAVTAVPELFSRADALAAGCDAYLLKPLNTRTLPDEINAVVTGKRNEPQQ